MDVGIDLTRIHRFVGKEEKFSKYILTPAEKQLYENVKKEEQAKFLAVRWACKEAIFKATQDGKYLSYSILKDEKGKPYVLNHRDMKISISHEDNMVIAIVVIE